MWSVPYDLSPAAALVDALFASALQRSDEPSAAQIRQAIAAVTGITPDGVTVGLLRRQIKDLSAVDIPGPHGHRG